MAVSGAGCTGSGGPNVLTAESLPWTGSTFRSLATGMPNNCLAIEVLGDAPVAVPLPTILPIGQPGCLLLAAPQVIGLRLPVGGALALALPLPDLPAFAGWTFHQQIVALAVDASGNLSAMTSTNALAVTKGTF